MVQNINLEKAGDKNHRDEKPRETRVRKASDSPEMAGWPME